MHACACRVKLKWEKILCILFKWERVKLLVFLYKVFWFAYKNKLSNSATSKFSADDLIVCIGFLRPKFFMYYLVLISVFFHRKRILSLKLSNVICSFIFSIYKNLTTKCPTNYKHTIITNYCLTLKQISIICYAWNERQLLMHSINNCVRN